MTQNSLSSPGLGSSGQLHHGMTNSIHLSGFGTSSTRLFRLILNKTITFLVLTFLFSSCATVLNRRTKRLDIITNIPAKVQINNNILTSVNNRTKIQNLRDIRPLTLSVFNDSISKDLVLDSRSSFAYWFNIYANCGLGMLIDNSNPKRYGYPRRIWVDMTNNKNNYTRYNPVIKKGELQLRISLPWINNFLLKPINENSTKSSLGYWGLMTGLDYYVATNHFINFSISVTADLFLPFPAVVDFSGEYDEMSSLFIVFSNNYKLKRFSAGYGISFSENTWNHLYSSRFNAPPPKREPVTKTDYSIGLLFPISIQAGEYFNLGLFYRPSFLKVIPELEFKYEHLISIDLAWKIPLNKN
jgi:hypothetical protein